MNPPTPAALPVVYYDCKDVLFTRRPEGWQARDVGPMLAAAAEKHRLGLLCNLPARYDVSAFRLLLRDHGIDRWFDPALMVIASVLPTPLPDPRAFAAAAAIAGVRPDALCYVTQDPALAATARSLGWKVDAPPVAAATPGLLADETVTATLLAGEIDEDTGPTFWLRGRIVTMDAGGTVVENGLLGIQQGKIAAVLRPGQAMPPALAGAPVCDTQSTLYPGLIDLHNHIPYNVVPLWQVPRRYDNRSQWQRHPDYQLSVSRPVVALASHEPTAKAIARYVETKALLGGVTTGQGMRMKVQGIVRHFVGALRNVESTEDPRLPEAATRVPDLNPTRDDDITGFRRSLTRAAALFYHLSEGVDDRSRRHFATLEDHNLIAPPLVGIHSLALGAAQFQRLAAKGAKVVWSPFSNILLYGSTLDLGALLASGVTFSLGCDWSPSGSKNLLCELKVARWEAQQRGVALSDEKLVRLVTSEAAKVVGWAAQVGMLRPGMLADVIAVAGTTGDVYNKLILARERDLQAVIIHGVPRHGDPALMRSFGAPISAQLEPVRIDGADKALYLAHAGGTLNDLSFGEARRRLQAAMNDLPAFVRDTSVGGPGLLGSRADQQFSLVLDMEPEDADDASGLLDAGLLALTPDQVARSVPLDAPETNDPRFWSALDNIAHMPAGLKAMLKAAYS